MANKVKVNVGELNKQVEELAEMRKKKLSKVVSKWLEENSTEVSAGDGEQNFIHFDVCMLGKDGVEHRIRCMYQYIDGFFVNMRTGDGIAKDIIIFEQLISKKPNKTHRKLTAEESKKMLQAKMEMEDGGEELDVESFEKYYRRDVLEQ